MRKPSSSRERDVDGVDMADAFDMDRLEIHLGAERDAGENGKLVRRVDAIDIEGRIGFGIAEALRIREHVGEGPPGFAHHGQDVVAGPVEDAVDARDAVGGDAFAQRLDRSESRRRPRPRRRALHPSPPRPWPAPCRGCASNALLAVTTCRPAAIAASTGLLGGTVAAADQLDDDIGIGPRGHLDRIVEPCRAGDRNAAIALPVARADRGDDQRTAAALLEQLALAASNFKQAASRPCRDRRPRSSEGLLTG